MVNGWSGSVRTQVVEALSAAARQLTGRGLPATVETVAGSGGVDACCLDIRFDRQSYAMLQVFDPELPNLGRFLTYDREPDGRPVDSHRLPVFGVRQDWRLTYDVLPVVNSALSPVDPTGRGRSLHVGIFHGRSTVGDLFLVPWTAVKSFRNSRRQGQLATIWADFDAPLAETLCRLSARAAGKRDIHLVPRTSTPSASWIPVPGEDPQWRIASLSNAFDTAIALARTYVRRHNTG